MTYQPADAQSLQAILDAAPQAFFAKDLGGRYTFVNRVLASRIGLPADEILGRTAQELSFEIGELSQALEDDVAGTGQPGQCEVTVTAPSGGSRILLVQKFPLLDGDGRLAGTCGIALDITERKRAEAELERARRQDTVSRLAGGIAHDFNNLLSIILNFAQFVADGLEERQLGLLADIGEVITAAQRAAALANRLLVFTEDSRPANQCCRPSAVITSEAAAFEAMLPPRGRLDVSTASDRAEVALAPGELVDAVSALVRNACQALAEGGLVRIESSGTADEAVIVVSDDGVGMSGDTLQRASEPFFTTRGPQAPGLGLSIVHGIARRAGGSLDFASTPELGTTVTLRLPWVRLAAGDTPIAVGSGLGTVLVVDDEPGVRAVVERVLKGAGYTVLGASSAAEARAVAAGSEIALLLTDVVMPGESGTDLARSLSHPTAVLYMSGFTEETGAFDRGTGGVLWKPFTPEQLLSAVALALARAGRR